MDTAAINNMDKVKRTIQLRKYNIMGKVQSRKEGGGGSKKNPND